MTQKQSIKMQTSQVIRIVALLVGYYAGALMLRTITNTETYAILGGLVVMGIVYGIFKIKSPLKNIDQDERIEHIVKGAWRAAYFAVFGILALVGFYQDVKGVPVAFTALFHLILIGSSLAFLLYYYFKSRS